MSTKIYNGYRRKTESLDDLQNFLNDFKEKAKRLHVKAYKKAFVNCVVGIIDARAAELENPQDDKSNSPYWLAFQVIQDEYTKTKMPNASRAMLFDFECSLSIFLENEYAYFLFFAEDKKFTNLFSRQKGVHTFNYWDNTDKPNNISFKKWLEHGDTWDRLLGPYGVPADRSMTLEVVGVHAGDRGMLRLVDIVKKLPSFEERVETMARRTVIKHWRTKSKEAPESITNLLSWIKSNEYNEFLKLDQVELAKKLKHTLEKEDIY